MQAHSPLLLWIPSVCRGVYREKLSSKTPLQRKNKEKMNICLKSGVYREKLSSEIPLQRKKQGKDVCSNKVFHPWKRIVIIGNVSRILVVESKFYGKTLW